MQFFIQFPTRNSSIFWGIQSICNLRNTALHGKLWFVRSKEKAQQFLLLSNSLRYFLHALKGVAFCAKQATKQLLLEKRLISSIV